MIATSSTPISLQDEDAKHVDNENIRAEFPEMKDALLRYNAADQEGDENDDRNRAPANLLEMMDGRDQAKRTRMAHHPAAGRQHRAQHPDQARQRRSEPDNIAPDVFEQADQRVLTGRGRIGWRDAANLIDQARIIQGESGNLRLEIALRQTAAQAFDQPCPESVESRDLRYVDEDIGPAASQFFGICDDLLEHRGEACRPGA